MDLIKMYLIFFTEYMNTSKVFLFISYILFFFFDILITTN